MISFTAQEQAALAARRVSARDFLWIVPRDRVTQAEVPFGFWSDVGTVDAQVIDPLTGATVMRTFTGAGTLISIDGVRKAATLAVQAATIRMSQLGNTDAVLRLYDPRRGRVEIFRGLFEPGTHVQIGPARCRFVGEIDDIQITTPREGEAGSATVTVVPATQQFTRNNPATRSDAQLRQRLATDSARRHVAVVGTWPVNWGSRGK